MDDFGTVMSWLIIVIILGCIYAIPSYVSRGRIRFWQVFWINILLGWSLIWWVVALVLALDKSNVNAEPEIVEADMKKLKKAIIWIVIIVAVFWSLGYFFW